MWNACVANDMPVRLDQNRQLPQPLAELITVGGLQNIVDGVLSLCRMSAVDDRKEMQIVVAEDRCGNRWPEIPDEPQDF